MPTISMFLGIIIRMYYDEHNPPHFHAEYNEFKASIDIRLLEISEGSLSARQAKMVLGWSALHQEALLANWKLAEDGETLFKIKPLE